MAFARMAIAGSMTIVTGHEKIVAFFLRKAPSKGERCESRQTCESDMWWLQERAG
jgi:hypothetical protein